VAGRKVMPQEIENALKAHPEVLDCLVFGVPSRDRARGEEIAVCVRASAPEAGLRAFLHGCLPSWKVPRHWWLTDELRPDARGKLSRDGWRKRFLHAFPELSG
jgi:acyl-CoA synthetase (AMP-forming)/AMP-acid ligase II